MAARLYTSGERPGVLLALCVLAPLSSLLESWASVCLLAGAVADLASCPILALCSSTSSSCNSSSRASFLRKASSRSFWPTRDTSEAVCVSGPVVRARFGGGIER